MEPVKDNEVVGFLSWLINLINKIIAGLQAQPAKVIPLPISYPKLAWEKDHPERAAWTKCIYDLVGGEFFTVFDSALDAERIHPRYKQMTNPQKIHMWCEFICQVSKHESSWNPSSRMKESTMGVDPVTKEHVYSEGLLQLSYQDTLSYNQLKLPISWEKKNILDPLVNLESGVRILAHQISKYKKAILTSNVYWAVIKDGGAYEKIVEITSQVCLAQIVPLDLTLKPSAEIVREAIKYLGVHEVGGNNRGPEVEKFQRAVDGVAGGEAWCMCFVQYIIKQVSARLQLKSPIFLSEHCQTTFHKSQSLLVIGTILPGDVIIWKHGNTSNGHTGFVESVIRDANGKAIKLNTIEGNTGDSSMRDGDGVYRRVRNMSGDGDMAIMGFLRPFQGV